MLSAQLPNGNFFLFLSLSLCSGLMYKSNFSIRRVPEVVAHSGAALLHFFSDDAYNMSGFNISYRFDSCPTTDSCKFPSFIASDPFLQTFTIK